MEKRETKKLLGALALCAALIAAFALFAGLAGRGSRAEQEAALEQLIRRAAVTCYAIEGRYPPDFGYLAANYGVSFDSTAFAVSYTPIGSNVMPDIDVIRFAD